jgi:phosphatidylserine/phosphatidylglycerophosphate/cardiolipin synthase-like enzyme
LEERHVWNHAKIVAVDGKHVYTGGHNLCDDVYLRKDPIHDTSIQLEGPVAIQAHQYANEQWEYIKEQQSTFKGWIVEKINDGLALPIRSLVTISEWSQQRRQHDSYLDNFVSWLRGTATNAPLFNKDDLPSSTDNECVTDEIKMLALGRCGKIRGNDDRSADDAFIAMFDAAQNSIRLLLQDLGPVNKTVLGKNFVYKSWPKNYMKALARAIFVRGVDVEIILSNIGSPGEARGKYSNGWSCEETAAEIIKTMSEEYPEATEKQIKEKVINNLRICFIKNKNGDTWETNNKVGLHSKFFIIDDVCTYVGWISESLPI